MSDLAKLPDDQLGRVQVVLDQIITACDVPGEVTIEETEDTIHVDVVGEDAGRLIGRRAQTLDAIQLLTYLISTNGLEDTKRVVIDIDGYRAEREAELIADADRIAQQVLASGEQTELDAMTSQERRAVHTHLLTVNGVDTHSVGEDPDRRIVISPVV